MAEIPTRKLNTGASIPVLGFGTWQLAEGRETRNAVKEALNAGYRLIDTAKIYGNEEGVGKTITSSKIPRNEIFLTTKLWNSDHGYENALKAFDESLSRLGSDYVDLYLVHWPGKDNIGSWKALIEIQKTGKAKAIGVSNFSVDDIKELITATGETPSVNQIELHPFIYEKQKETLLFCNEHGILVEAYSPLSRGKNMDNAALGVISKKLGKSPAQIVLRWSIQHGFVPIPKSSHSGRIKDNIDVFNFELSSEEMIAIDELGGTKSSLPFYVRLLK